MLGFRTLPAEAQQARRLRRVLFTALLLVVFAGATGCSTYADRAAQLRQRAVTGDFDGALALFGDEPLENADVLALMERGLLLYHQGRYEEAINAFQLAQAQIDELYTKSVTKEALAFLTNDGTLPYTGYPAEQVLLHTYAALSYLALGQLDAALVECRGAAEQLQAMEFARADKKGYTDDAFTEWLAAMIYAEDGDANSCLVSCRRALAAFREYDELWGQPVPVEFLQDYTLWARRFGFPEEADELAERYGEIVTDARGPLPGEGEVVLLYESGFVDRLEELRVDFPILETDDRRDDEEYATTVYRRGHRGRWVRRDEDVKIKYWLSVATPTVVRSEPALRRARMIVGDQVDDTEVVEDVSAVFRLTFDEGAGKRMVRTIARGLAKYATVQAVKNGEDGAKREVAGFLANLVASATERADTRSWTMLPDTMQLARLRVPEGVHAVEVEVLDASGRVAQTASFEQVRVIAGERTILHHRSFE